MLEFSFELGVITGIILGPVLYMLFELIMIGPTAVREFVHSGEEELDPKQKE